MGGWTRTPNFIYDLMPSMKAAELKVVMAISRQTSGWQRDCATMRLADIEALTGLSHPSVVSGIKDAMAHGILGREVQGETFVYWLIDPCETDDIVKNFNTEEANSDAESKNSLPSEVKKVNSGTVKKVNTNKRYIYINKQTTKKKEIAANAAPPATPVDVPAKPKRSRKPKDPPSSEKPPREPTEWVLFLEALCWVCHGHKDIGALTEAQRGQLTSEGKTIRSKDFTTDDLREWYKTVWAQGWQYKQSKKARPKPADVRSSIAQLRAETPEGFEVVGVSHAATNGELNRQALANVVNRMKGQLNGHG